MAALDSESAYSLSILEELGFRVYAAPPSQWDGYVWLGGFTSQETLSGSLHREVISSIRLEYLDEVGPSATRGMLIASLNPTLKVDRINRLLSPEDSDDEEGGVQEIPRPSSPYVVQWLARWGIESKGGGVSLDMHALPDLPVTISGDRVAARRWSFPALPGLLLFACDLPGAVVRVVSWAFAEEAALSLIRTLQPVIPGSRLWQELMLTERVAQAAVYNLYEA